MGRTNIGSHEYQRPQPVGAPSAATADAAWGLLPNVSLSDIMPAYTARKNFPVECRPGAELTAKQALLVALDTVLACARDRDLLYGTRAFDALARIWSETFRNAAPATTIWDMREETVVAARRELLSHGIDFARIWDAVCDGVPGLYTVRRRKKAEATLRDVRHARGAEKAWRALMSDAGEYFSPPPRVRLLYADDKMPPLKIDQRVAGECVHDRMEIGERSKAVIAHLQGVCLHLDIAAVLDDAKDAQAKVRAHPWRGMLRSWEAEQREKPYDREAYQAARKEFMAQHTSLHTEFMRLTGRSNHLMAVVREVRRLRRRAGEEGFLAIKSAYYRTRNRRWQARHIWTTESSSRVDDSTVIRTFEEFDADLGYLGDRQEAVDTSARGRWFYARPRHGVVVSPSDPDEPDPWEWLPERARRAGLVPLFGVDISFSMGTIIAVLLGQREDEQTIVSKDFKDGLVEALDVVAAAVPDFHKPSGTHAQLRKGIGALQNTLYGAGYAGITRKLRDDPATYGAGWANLKAFVEKGRAFDPRVALLARLRDEWLEMCRALVQVAAERDAYAGVTFTDPFDGAVVRWHPPGRTVVPVGHDLLYTAAPLGVERDGEYPVNFFGVERPTGVKGRTRESRLNKDGAKAEHGWKLERKGSLYNMLAPCLIHTLDAAFAAFVVEHLVQRDIRDFAIVHDCFLVPYDAQELLTQAIINAGRPWFQSLGPIYDLFDAYLGSHPVHGDRVRRWRATWEARKEAGTDWPKFRVKPETTQAWKIERA